MQAQIAVSTASAPLGAEEEMIMTGEALVRQADVSVQVIGQLAGALRELQLRENQLQALSNEVGTVNTQLGEILPDAMSFFTKGAGDDDNLFPGLN